MMVLFAGFLLSIAPAAFAAAFFRRRVELTLPCALMGNAVLMYGAFLCGESFNGVMLIYLLNTLLLVPTFCKAAGDMKNFAACFFTPGLAAYCFLSLLFFSLNRERLFFFWDEFTHWGLAAKAVYQYSKLPCELGSLLNFPSYPPSLVMSQYLYLSAHGKFAEYVVYFAGFQLFAAMFALVLGQKSWSKWRENIFETLLIWLLPQAFICYFYSSYVDGMLGMVFAYALVLIFADGKPSWGMALSLVPTLIYLTLIKGSGSGLAYLVFGTLMVQMWRCRRELRPADAFLPVVVLCGIIFAVYSWKYMVAVSGCPVSFSGAKITPAALWDAAVNNIPRHSWVVAGSWLKKFILNQPWSPEFFEYAPGALPTVLVFSGFALWSVRKSSDVRSKRDLRLIALLGPLFTVIFAVTLLVYYIFDFPLFEALYLASFERYINTVVLAFYMVLLIMTAKDDDGGVDIKFDLPLILLVPLLYMCCRCYVIVPEYFGKYANAAAAGIYIGLIVVRHRNLKLHGGRTVKFNARTLLMLLPLIMLPQIFIFTNRMIRRDYGFRRGEAELITRQLKQHQNPGEKVTVIHQATHGLTYFLLRYCAFPDVVIYPWSIGGKQYDSDVWSVPKSADEFKSDLLAAGGILYLHEVNEFFRKRYSQLFADASAVGSGRFYRMGSDGKLRELENATLPLIIDNFNFFLPAGNKWRAISFDGKTIKCRVNDKLVLDLQDTKLLYSAVYRKVKIAGHSRGRGLHLTFCGKNGVKNGVSLPGDGDFEVTFNLPDKPLGGVSLELTAAAEPGEISLNQVTLGR